MSWHVNPEVIHQAAADGHHLYPYAEYRPIPEATTQPEILPWSFILHTMAGPSSTTPDQLWRYVNRPDIRGESHLILGYSSMIQSVPFNVRADNNADANSWWRNNERVGAVSVETQDEGSRVDPGIALAPWNHYQLNHLAGVAAFLHLRYGIPLTRCKNWDSRGVDGHRAHNEWSIYTGKTCPGQTRWEQIPRLLEMAAEIVDGPPPPPPPEGDEMAQFAKVHATDTAVLVVTTTDARWLPTAEEVEAAKEVCANDPLDPIILTPAQCKARIFLGRQPHYHEGSLAGSVRCRAEMWAQG